MFFKGKNSALFVPFILFSFYVIEDFCILVYLYKFKLKAAFLVG